MYPKVVTEFDIIAKFTYSLFKQLNELLID